MKPEQVDYEQDEFGDLVMTCPECEGAGYFIKDVYYRHDAVAPQYENCQRCNGAEWVEAVCLGCEEPVETPPPCPCRECPACCSCDMDTCKCPEPLEEQTKRQE